MKPLAMTAAAIQLVETRNRPLLLVHFFRGGFFSRRRQEVRMSVSGGFHPICESRIWVDRRVEGASRITKCQDPINCCVATQNKEKSMKNACYNHSIDPMTIK